MKTTVALLILFITVLGGGYALYAYQHPATEEAQTIPTGEVTSNESTTTEDVSAPSGTTGTSVSPAKPDTYTSAQVASHNTSKSCWSSISGSVYDLTSWISKHPGGEARILSICGKDGTQMFGGQHVNDPRAMQTLASFKIGTLAS